MKRPRGPLLALALLTVLVVSGVPTRRRQWPQAPGSVSPGQWGLPTTRISVAGQGFGPTEVVDLTFDSQPNRKATTDPSGRFSSPLRVPASALPGDHTVTATEKTSGRTASAPFRVRTDWPMFKFGPDHTGLNPYEISCPPDRCTHADQGEVPVRLDGDREQARPLLSQANLTVRMSAHCRRARGDQAVGLEGRHRPAHLLRGPAGEAGERSDRGGTGPGRFDHPAPELPE